jgi:segregation and condensation protein B
MEEELEVTVEATDAQEPVAEEQAAVEVLDTEALIPDEEPQVSDGEEARKLAVLEAIVYVTDEPLTVAQMAGAMGEPVEAIRRLLEKLVAEYERPEHGLAVREVAGGYKMATKPEHHEAVRAFVKNLNPPLKLSLAALETLAVIAYKQPLTAPEIMEIRGVQGAGVLKTLLDRKLITTAGRKSVVGKPILYKTTKEFLVQFGLKDLNELPSLKEFEELRRLAFQDVEEPAVGAEPGPAAVSEAQPEPASDAEAAPETTPEPAPEPAPEPETSTEPKS